MPVHSSQPGSSTRLTDRHAGVPRTHAPASAQLRDYRRISAGIDSKPGEKPVLSAADSPTCGALKLRESRRRHAGCRS
jgi:hypothetical protein